MKFVTIRSKGWENYKLMFPLSWMYCLSYLIFFNISWSSIFWKNGLDTTVLILVYLQSVKQILFNSWRVPLLNRCHLNQLNFLFMHKLCIIKFSVPQYPDLLSIMSEKADKTNHSRLSNNTKREINWSYHIQDHPNNCSTE